VACRGGLVSAFAYLPICQVAATAVVCQTCGEPTGPGDVKMVPAAPYWSRHGHAM